MKNQFFYPVRNADNPYDVQLVPVTEDVYRSINPEIERTRKQIQRSGRCVCPYSACGNTVSYDTKLDDAEGLTLGDTLVSDEPSHRRNEV